jgi:hypothetical protein
MLTYADRCLERNEISAARQTLEQYAVTDPNAPYVQARFVQILLEENRGDEAVEEAFEIWCRPGMDVEWADHTAWIALIPPEEHMLADGLADRIRDILRNGDHIRPLIVEWACSLKSKLGYDALFRAAGSHPLRAAMLSAVLSGMIEQEKNQKALRLWESLGAEDKNVKVLRQCGLRLLFSAHSDERCMNEIRRIMRYWNSLPDVEMWTVGIYIFVLEWDLDLIYDTEEPLSDTQKSRLPALEKHCRECLTTLQFDEGAQFIIASLCKSLLAQGKTDEFEETFMQFENILTDSDRDYWRPPLAQSFLISLSRLRSLLRDEPIDLESVCRFGMDESGQEFYPVYMFRCLVEALRQREDVINRDAECLISYDDPSTAAETGFSFTWMWLLPIFLLLRACSSYLRDM